MKNKFFFISLTFSCSIFSSQEHKRSFSSLPISPVANQRQLQASPEITTAQTQKRIARLTEINNLAASLPASLRSGGDSKQNAEKTGNSISYLPTLETATQVPQKGLMVRNLGAGIGIAHGARVSISDCPDIPLDPLSEDSAIRGVGLLGAGGSFWHASAQGYPSIFHCVLVPASMAHIIAPKKTKDFYVGCLNYAQTVGTTIYEKIPTQSQINQGYTTYLSFMTAPWKAAWNCIGNCTSKMPDRKSISRAFLYCKNCKKKKNQ